MLAAHIKIPGEGIVRHAAGERRSPPPVEGMALFAVFAGQGDAHFHGPRVSWGQVMKFVACPGLPLVFSTEGAD